MGVKKWTENNTHKYKKVKKRHWQNWKMESIDCFISLEEPFWADKDVSIITRIGKSNIYFAINKDHPEIKKELELVMHQLEEERPFYLSDLYRQYFFIGLYTCSFI